MTMVLSKFGLDGISQTLGSAYTFLVSLKKPKPDSRYGI